MSQTTRKKIPPNLEQELYLEAGWRCAVPACRTDHPLEMAHLQPLENGGEDAFSNMILLCRNCHGRFDSKDETRLEKRITREQMIIVKKNLMIINGRYSHFEMRIIEYFSSTKESSIKLWGREFDVMHLVKDGLLIKSDIRQNNAINFPPEIYYLTDKGRNLIDAWKSAELWDDKVCASKLPKKSRKNNTTKSPPK